MSDPGLAVLITALWIAGCGSDESRPVEGGESPAADSRQVAALEAGTVVGETVYVPVYSHIFFQDGGREIDLTATLSLRNTDPDRAVTIGDVQYRDSDGELVRRYEPVVLPPLASRSYVVAEQDRAGGVGASFVVQWGPDAEVSAPVIEAVMIGTAGSQGISFVSRGQAVRPLEAE